MKSIALNLMGQVFGVGRQSKRYHQTREWLARKQQSKKTET